MSQIDVTVTDAGGAMRKSVTVPDDAQAVKIIAALVDQLKLPLTSPDGTPMSYKFHHHETSRQIGDDVTLASVGVAAGHTLRLIPEIIAG
jgi:hypothetical protein